MGRVRLTTLTTTTTGFAARGCIAPIYATADGFGGAVEVDAVGGTQIVAAGARR